MGHDSREIVAAEVCRWARDMPEQLRAHIERRAGRLSARELVEVLPTLEKTAEHWRRVVAWWPDGGAFLFDLLARSESMYAAAGGDGRHEGAKRDVRYQHLGVAARKLDAAVKSFQVALEKMPDARMMLHEAGESVAQDADDRAALEALRALAGGAWRGRLQRALSILDGTENEGLAVGKLGSLERVKARSALRKLPTRGGYVRRTIVVACCRWEARERSEGREPGDWPMVALSEILSAAGVERVGVKNLDDIRREERPKVTAAFEQS